MLEAGGAPADRSHSFGAFYDFPAGRAIGHGAVHGPAGLLFGQRRTPYLVLSCGGHPGTVMGVTRGSGRIAEIHSCKVGVMERPERSGAC